MCCGDVGYGVLHAQVEREGGVDEGCVMKGNPCGKVRPGLGIAGEASCKFAEKSVELASALVPLLPMRLLTFLRLDMGVILEDS